MRVLLQRVSEASVTVHGQVVGEIERGLLALVGVGRDDGAEEAVSCAKKVRFLRLFADEDKPMNRDVVEVGGSVLVVSQFTLMAATTKGRRPSFDKAAPGPMAEPLVERFVQELERLGVTTASGTFGADMKVALVNDGPVTVMVDI